MKPLRIEGVDALRGFAMLWMAVFHFSFDLNQYHYVRIDFQHDVWWTTQRTCILSLFLWCAGVGSAFSSLSITSQVAWLKRISQIAGCSVLVTVGSYFMFPQTFIYFGILHAMVVMLLLSRFLSRMPRWLLVGAVFLCWSAPHLYAMIQPSFQTQSMLNKAPWNILGLITVKPYTEDFVPLLPWIGVFMAGLLYGQWRVMQPERGQRSLGWFRPLARLGHWSLTFYMLHQPILLGGLTAYRWLS